MESLNIAPRLDASQVPWCSYDCPAWTDCDTRHVPAICEPAVTDMAQRWRWVSRGAQEKINHLKTAVDDNRWQDARRLVAELEVETSGHPEVFYLTQFIPPWSES